MSELTLFENPQFGKVRVIMRGNEPWFVGSDVASCLGYARANEAVAAYCKKAEIYGQCGEQHNTGYGDLPYPENSQFQQDCSPLDPQTKLIPESDLYRLIMRSHLPAAEAFQDWVVEEVLPSIRKTGSYVEIEKPQEIPPTAYEKFQIMRDVLTLAYEGNQLTLAVDKVCVRITGESALKVADAQLIAPQQKQLYTPTQIGKNVNPIISAVKVNKILESLGWQIKIDDKWEKCGAGEAHGIYLDTGKAHSDGTPIRQLKWESDTIFAVQDYLNTHLESAS